MAVTPPASCGTSWLRLPLCGARRLFQNFREGRSPCVRACNHAYRVDTSQRDRTSLHVGSEGVPCGS